MLTEELDFIVYALQNINLLAYSHSCSMPNHITPEDIRQVREYFKPHYCNLKPIQCLWLDEIFDDEEWSAAEREFMDTQSDDTLSVGSDEDTESITSDASEECARPPKDGYDASSTYKKNSSPKFWTTAPAPAKQPFLSPQEPTPAIDKATWLHPPTQALPGPPGSPPAPFANYSANSSRQASTRNPTTTASAWIAVNNNTHQPSQTSPAPLLRQPRLGNSRTALTTSKSTPYRTSRFSDGPTGQTAPPQHKFPDLGIFDKFPSTADKTECLKPTGATKTQ